MWEECDAVVENAWTMHGNEGFGLSQVKQKIDACGMELKTWSAGKKNPDKEAIKQLQKRLDILNSGEITEASRDEYLPVSKTLDDLLLKQEIFWAQRSRISWLKHGDKNTKFFHAKASQRKRRNHIQKITKSDGGWVEEEEDKARVAIDYFNNLFAAGNCDQMEECLSKVSNKVTPSMIQILSSDFSADEIKAAVFQMAPTKAPGPDGMNALFYQKFWHIVGDNIVSAVLDFFSSGCMASGLNHTNIVLIPKVKQPEKMSDFRPISLCNVMYKIISKVLGNRLKQILPHVISPTQSAFVPGRLITDRKSVV